MIDDAELLLRYVASRSEEAFAAFVERHLNLVYFAALRRVGGNAALAEEIAQQVFTLVAREAGSLQRHATVTGWLYTTTRNLATKAVRAEQARKRREEEFHSMQENNRAPALDWEQLRPAIDETLEGLNPREREAVLLRFFEGRTFGEMATVLKTSEDAARMRVERALEKSRALLSRRGVTSTSAALATVLANQASIAAPTGLAASIAGTALAGAAGAAAASGSVAAFLSFMSTSKIAATTAVLALVATVGLTLREVRLDRETAAAVQSARTENAALDAGTRELHRKTEAAIREAESLQRAIASLLRPAEPEPAPQSVAARGTRTGAGPGGGGGGSGSEDLNTPEALALGREYVTKHPEARRYLELVQRDLFERSSFGTALAALKVSPEEYEAIYQEYARLWPRELRLSSFGPQASAGASRSQRAAEINPFIREVLGEERFKQYENYPVMEPAVNVVQAFASAAQRLGAPLLPGQAERLLDILQRRAARPGSPYLNLSDTAPVWTTARPELEKTLSAEQLAALDLLVASGNTIGRRRL